MFILYIYDIYIYVYMILYIYDIYIYILYIYSMVLQDRDEGLLLDLSVFTDPPQPYQAAMAWCGTPNFSSPFSIHRKMIKDVSEIKDGI